MLTSTLQNNKLASVSRLVFFLPACFFSIALFVVPAFYEARITTGFYKTDLYIICITGCLSWAALSFEINLPFTKLTSAVTAACCYVLILCLAKSFPDDNSINATLIILSCVGIVCYLHAIGIPKYRMLVQAALVISLVVQLLIGLRQLYSGYGNAGLIQGQMANSGAFANYLSAIIPWLLAIGIAKDDKARVIRRIAVVLLLAAAVLLMFTQARAAFAGTVVGCVFVVYSLSTKEWRCPRLWVVVGCIIIVPVIVFALYRLKPASAQGGLLFTRCHSTSYKIIH